MITNVVACADLSCNIDLRALANTCANCIYDPKKFSSVMWKSRTVGGLCMVFSNGKIMVNGKVTCVKDCKRRLRRYARLIQRLGWQVRLKKIKVCTISAHFKMDDTPNLPNIARRYDGRYDPDRFPALHFSHDGISYTVFHTGTILMTGIKKECQLQSRCIPTILNMTLV